MTWIDANTTLTAESLSLGAITFDYNDTTPAGLVAAQSPAAGASAAVGWPIGIVISLGQPAVVMTAGGNRLVELQNNDGGWDLPLDDGDANTGSDPDVLGPIATGLAKAYHRTQDPNILAALQKSKLLFLAKSDNFTTADGAAAVELDRALGGTACVDHVVTNFYDKLAAGTYYDAQSGTTHTTASYVQALRGRYTGSLSNLAAWDLGLALYNAHLVGDVPTYWRLGLEAEIDELDETLGNDVLGLAGAVLGLAAVDQDYDPQAGAYAAASSLSDLAEILASYQLNSGGFTWHAGLMKEDFDEMVQETTYAVMALNEFDRIGYLAQIGNAGIYIQNIQLATNGWKNNVDDDEDNQITGEALWGMAVSLPALGDFDLDTVVNSNDFAIFALAWLTEPGDAHWRSACDMAMPRDYVIDALDLGAFVECWMDGAE
jgi:hypothetical protein